jgi:non-canonical purine NTP pyrophosphatase (RdgB/HAM1 family)
MQKLTFITGNKHKAEELENYLGIAIDCYKLDLPEIQSLDLEEVAIAKAKEAYEIIGAPVLVEDTALTFSSLGKLPGPFIKHFLESLQNEGLTKILNTYDNRGALALSCFVLRDENGSKVFMGETKGVIADNPRGENGFGWDAVFIPDGETKTWAEMSKEEKQRTSMRAKALEKLSDYLKIL